MVGVQKSVHVNEDLRPVAAVIDGHPRIDYKPEDIEDPDLSSQALVEKMWHQMSGSSVWLPELRVYLLVTRVLFGENIFWPTISFLRGRVFDEDWEELHDYTITGIISPTIFLSSSTLLFHTPWTGSFSALRILESLSRTESSMRNLSSSSTWWVQHQTGREQCIPSGHSRTNLRY